MCVYDIGCAGHYADITHRMLHLPLRVDRGRRGAPTRNLPRGVHQRHLRRLLGPGKCGVKVRPHLPFVSTSSLDWRLVLSWWWNKRICRELVRIKKYSMRVIPYLQVLRTFVGFLLLVVLVQSLHLLRNQSVFVKFGAIYRKAAAEVVCAGVSDVIYWITLNHVWRKLGKGTDSQNSQPKY